MLAVPRLVPAFLSLESPLALCAVVSTFRSPVMSLVLAISPVPSPLSMSYLHLVSFLSSYRLGLARLVRLGAIDLYLCWAVLFVLLVVVVVFIVFVVVLLSSTTSTPTNTIKTTTSIIRFIATFTTQHTLNYGT